MSGSAAGGDRSAALVDGLAALDARAWGQLLRSLRALGLPATAELLARPSSELVAGAPRDQLCALIADDVDLRTALRGDLGLPAAVHALLAAAAPDAADVPPPATPAATSAAGPATAAPTDPAGPAVTPAADDGEGRSAERARALRRSRDEERRRREGAEARATAAEARAEEARVAAERDRAALTEREAALARAEEATADAVARAERRAAGRIASLEEELATERRTADELRRTAERLRGEVEALRAELARTPAPAGTTPAAGPGGGAQRPLQPPAELEPDSTDAARWLATRCDRLLVDGYNVVLSLRPGRPLEEQRRWLVDRLRPLAARGLVRPLIVFDGAGRTGGLRDTGGVEVRFTAGGASADDEIVFEVAATDRPMLVVTDDVELGVRVRAEGGNVVGTVHLPGIADA